MNPMTRLKLSGLLVLALLALLGITYVKGCKAGQRGAKTAPSYTDTKPSAVLQPGQKERINVDLDSNRVTVTTHAGTKTSEGVRHAQITETQDGQINVVAPSYGFVFEPGLSLFASSGSGRMGFDACLFYWKNFDALVGFGINPPHLLDAVGYVGLGWTPPLKLFSNTDLWAGIDTRKSPAFGVRISF